MKPALFLPSFLFTIMLAVPAIHPVSAQRSGGTERPKNVILMIGDGMGYNHVLAADYYFGVRGQVFREFPVKVAMATYPAKAGEYKEGVPGSNYYATGYNTVAAWKDTAYLKQNYTESAAAATAMATGFKTYNNAIGLSVDGDTLQNLTEFAKSLGKSAGVVTSVLFSHATPAGFVAHNKVRTAYAAISYDMILKSRCDVIMGTGDPRFDENGKPLTGKWKNAASVGDSLLWLQLLEGSGKRTQFSVKDKIFQVGDVNGDGKPDPWTVVGTRESFRALQTGKTPARVLGCAQVFSTLQQGRTMLNGENRNSPPYVTPFNTTVPSLAEMASGALNVLDNNPKGFFLMIEGGAIDWAAHSNQKGRLIEEVASFGEAVEAVIRWVEKNSNWNETMLIVTGDHETGLLWGDHPFEPLKDNGKGNLPGMTFFSGDHSNSLIALYSKGAGSELFRSFADERDSVRGPFIQNSEIAQVVRVLWGK